MIKAGGEITHQMAEWNVLESFTCAMEEGGSLGGIGELGFTVYSWTFLK